MVAAEEAFLDVGVDEPAAAVGAAQDVVDAAAVVARASVLLGLPARVHTGPRGMERAAEIPQHGLLAAWVKSADDAAAEYEVVEQAARGR